MSFTVAIVGRPNVGKSTAVQPPGRPARRAGRRPARRDARPARGEARLGDLAFTVIDTAGLDEAAPESLYRPHAGADRGRDRAGRRGLLPDRRTHRPDARRPCLRRSRAQVRQAGDPVANKSEGAARRSRQARGLCARSGRSGADLSRARRRSGRSLRGAARGVAGRDRVARGCRAPAGRRRAVEEARPQPIRVAVVGRPNAGKSTLVNRLLGEERLADRAGSRHHARCHCGRSDWQGRQFRVHDTAGLRRRSRVEEKLEKLSVADALEAIRFAEVVVLLMDATAPL